MQTVKAFIGIDSQVINTFGINSTIGELSTWSRTYSKEIGEYTDSDFGDYKLHVFNSVDSNTGNNIAVSPAHVKLIFNIISAAISYSNSHVRPLNPTDFRNTLVALFNGQISSLGFNTFVDNGTISLPEWLSFNILDSNGLAINEVKIWTADLAFQEQYDLYTIEVIPPLDDVDGFFSLYNTAINNLAVSNTLSNINDKIQIKKNGNPETFVRFQEFDFYNSVNPTQKTSVIWGVVIYGKAGDTSDIIKDAIVNYILTYSTHTKDQWEVIFPDLFKRVEFVFLPRWDKIAVPNLTSNGAVYSPMSNIKEALAFAKNSLSFFTASFIEDNAYIVANDYKSINLIAVNGNNNVIGKQKLDEFMQDYIAVPSTSADFGRMTIPTQQFSLMLSSLVQAAETATEFTSTPAGIRKAVRNGILFLTGSVNGVNYLVATKSNSFYN